MLLSWSKVVAAEIEWVGLEIHIGGRHLQGLLIDGDENEEKSTQDLRHGLRLNFF